VRRIKRDEALREELIEILVDTDKGERETQFLRLEVVPYWLAGVTISKTKPELRDKLLAYKRWVVRKVYEAFMLELSATAAEPAPPSPNVQNLLNLRELGTALVQFAEAQLALEHRQDDLTERQSALENIQHQTNAEVTQLRERLDNAATVVGRALTRIRRLEERTEPGTITEEQAAEISQSVRQIATELARREQSEGNPYQRVFTALYQRYGITSYKQLPVERYTDALGWLTEWYQSLLPPSTSSAENPQ
jgi:dephospho-CoA kinase